VEPGERSVRVSVQAKSFRCEANVVLPKDSYRGRVLDLLNAGTEFLALTEVLLYKTGAEASEEPVPYDVLLLRKGEIEFVEPLEDYW